MSECLKSINRRNSNFHARQGQKLFILRSICFTASIKRTSIRSISNNSEMKEEEKRKKKENERRRKKKEKGKR